MGSSYVNVTDGVLNNNDTDEVLEATYHHYLMMYMPIILFMGITTVMGLVGNILTILFFGMKARKTSTIVFIVAVAVLDFTVCLMACTTIADMCMNVYFSGPYLCKTMYFFDHWTVVSSVLVLWAISIDRYRKICKPFGRQLKVKTAFIAVFVLIGLSLVTSVQTFVTYDVVQVDIAAPDGKNRVLGNYCTNTDEPDLSIVVTVFHIFDAAMIAAVFITFVVTYSRIWYVLRKTRKRRQTMGFQKHVSKEVSSSDKVFTSLSNLNNSASADSLGSKVTARITLGNGSLSSNDNVLQSSNNSLEVPQFNVVQTQKTESKPVSKTSKSERNITIMMLAVSVGYVICFIPYFIVSAIRMVTPTGEKEMAAWVQFLLRSPFYNSVINPVIFCFFNPQFRRYIKGMILGCKMSQYVFSTNSRDDLDPKS